VAIKTNDNLGSYFNTYKGVRQGDTSLPLCLMWLKGVRQGDTSLPLCLMWLQMDSLVW
jgi:hypothetical protein